MHKKASGNCQPQYGHYKMANERENKFHNDFLQRMNKKSSISGLVTESTHKDALK